MLSLITTSKAQNKLVTNIRARRLIMDLTQEGLASRSGVALATLRKFEQHGIISLESFLKILMVVGGLDEVVQATKPMQSNFSSIDAVISSNSKASQQLEKGRGRRK